MLIWERCSLRSRCRHLIFLIKGLLESFERFGLAHYVLDKPNCVQVCLLAPTPNRLRLAGPSLMKNILEDWRFLIFGEKVSELYVF